MKLSIIGGGGRVGSCAAFALQCGGLVSEIQILDANKDLADGEVELSLKLGNLAEIHRWVLSWGEHARVIAPKELQSRIAETIENPMDHRFVLIAPATKTTTSFENYFNMMHFSPALRQAFLDELKKHTHLPLSYFEADRAVENYAGKVLWVHDKEDLVCPFKDLTEIQKKAPKNINFLITNGLGHNKIYKTPEIIDKIMAFLSPNE